MKTLLVANIKGGCGKTTVATTLSAALSVGGYRTLLADADRQGSSHAWCHARPAHAAPISVQDWSKSISRPPKRIDWVVVDAPAAMRRGQIEDLVGLADLVVLPVLPSRFDEAATERFIRRLDEIKAVRKDKTSVLVVGNRLRFGTRAARRLDDFLDGIGHRVVTRLRDSQLYPDVAALGLSLFDMATKRAALVRSDWDPLMVSILGEPNIEPSPAPAPWSPADLPMPAAPL